MANFPLFQMAEESVKFRFQEPFGSQAANLKDAGIIPPGIFRGYEPNPQPNYQLFINTDGVNNDSVAAIETPTHYNLTIRTEQQLVLDFSGHTTFPVFVVLRGNYSLSPHPFSGNTDAKIVTTQVIQPGDIRICSVTGIGALNAPIVDVSLADRNGGYLLTPGGNLARVIANSGGFSMGGGGPTSLPSSTIAFALNKTTLVDFQFSLFSDLIFLQPFAHDSTQTALFQLRNLNTLVLSDFWLNEINHSDSGSHTYPYGLYSYGSIRRRLLSLPAGNYNFDVVATVSGGAAITLTYPMSFLVFGLGSP